MSHTNDNFTIWNVRRKNINYGKSVHWFLCLIFAFIITSRAVYLYDVCVLGVQLNAYLKKKAAHYYLSIWFTSMHCTKQTVTWWATCRRVFFCPNTKYSLQKFDTIKLSIVLRKKNFNRKLPIKVHFSCATVTIQFSHYLNGHCLYEFIV